jgi:hypothetical protein
MTSHCFLMADQASPHRSDSGRERRNRAALASGRLQGLLALEIEESGWAAED